MDETTFKCKLDNANQMVSFTSDKVRWLDVVKDYDMIKEYFKVFNVDIEEREPNSMYFGINVNDYSETKLAKGKLCAFIDNGNILSFAGVKYTSSNIWEICAGSTHPQYLSKGYCKAVTSFIAKYILENNKRAFCETNIDNKAAQKVLQEIGMIRI